MPEPANPSPVLMVLAPNEWAGPWMNRQQLLSRLGVTYRIVYSTGIPQLGKRTSPDGGWAGSVRPTDHVMIDCPPAWLIRPTRFAPVRRLAEWVAVQRWRRLARAHGGGPLVAYVFHPKFWPLVRRLQPARLVYHAYDLYHLQGKVQHSFDEQERALVAAADLVVASSAPIRDHLRSIGNRHVELIENGVDYDMFAALPFDGAAEPDDLRTVPRPRVAYTGALNRKVDFALFAQLAARLPSVQFVFVGRLGRLDPEGARAVEQLQHSPNAHFLGFKQPQDLPAYMAAVDVNVMAYRIADDVWTAGIYPLKLHEYLAVGRPVVSSDLVTVRPFGDVVRIAAGADDWAAAIDEALRGAGAGTPVQRRATARENSWAARAQRLESLIQQLAPARAGQREAGTS